MLQATFSDMLTSFERDEAQAAADQELPLYPQGGRIITPLRQPSLQRPQRGSEGTAAGALTARADTLSGMRPLRQPGMQWSDGAPEATASGAGALAHQGGGSGAVAAVTSSGKAVGLSQVWEQAGDAGPIIPHTPARDAPKQEGNPGRVAEVPASLSQGQASHSEADQAAEQQAATPPSRQSLAPAEHMNQQQTTDNSPGLQPQVEEDSAVDPHGGQSGNMLTSPPGRPPDVQAQLPSPGSPAWQAEQQLRSIEVAQLSAIIAAEATAVAKYQLGVGSALPELLPEGHKGARRSPQKPRCGVGQPRRRSGAVVGATAGFVNLPGHQSCAVAVAGFRGAAWGHCPLVRQPHVRSTAVGLPYSSMLNLCIPRHDSNSTCQLWICSCRAGLERLKAVGRRHREPLVVQNPNMPTSPVAQQFAHQQQGHRGQQRQSPDDHHRQG